jgi:hypothetical protein
MTGRLGERSKHGRQDFIDELPADGKRAGSGRCRKW